MLNDDQRAATSRQYPDHDHALDPDQNQDQDDEHIREIHALTPPHPPARPANCGRQRDTWEVRSHRSSSLSMGSSTTSSTENFTSMSREFNALVIAGSAIGNNGINNDATNLARIREDGMADHQEPNQLAIVVDNSPLDPLPSLRPATASTSRMSEVSMHRAKKDEIDSKILAWQTAKISKINNRFKREDTIINVWESEQVQKATTYMKKIERKLEEKRARALEKMQNEVAKAQRKAEEKRASAEARRGTKVARLLEVANLMRAVGRPPAKRSFF